MRTPIILRSALIALCATLPLGAPARAQAPELKDTPGSAPTGAIKAIHIQLIGKVTGRLHELSDADGWDDLNTPGPGREPADSFLADVELHGPPGTEWGGVDLDIRAFSVEYGPDGSKLGGELIAERHVFDVDFGPTGVLHEDLFVDRHLCRQVTILARLQGPGDDVKAELPFSCKTP